MPYKNPEDKARWRRENRDKSAEYVRRWKERNPDYQKQWREKNPEKYEAYLRKLRKGKRALRRLRHVQNEWSRISRRRTKEAAFARLGGKCQRCGLDDQRILEIDHRVPLENKQNKSSRQYRRPQGCSIKPRPA